MFCFDFSLSLPDMLRKIAMSVAGLMCGATLLVAQPTIHVSHASANNGEMVTISLSIDNYTNYTSLQFTLNWNPDILSYQDVSNLTNGLPGFTPSSSINLMQNGVLNIVWFDSNLNPTTLANGTTLFDVSFQVTGNPCDSTGLTLSGIEIVDTMDQDVGATVDPGYVTVPGTGCGTFNGVQIIGEQKTVGPGDDVCIQFTCKGFTNVVAGSYTITFDPSVLQYTGIQNIDWPDFAQGTTFGDAEAASGILRVVWTDPNVQGVDIADGTVLYELCFKAIGSGGQMSQIGFGNNPIAIEFADPNSQPIEFQGVPGKVKIEGALEGFALIFPDVDAMPGDTVCVPITVNEFVKIIAIQTSMTWDSTILQFVGFQGFNLPDLASSVAGPEAPGLNASQAVIAWIDNTIQGISLPNGTELMELCFKVIGACDQSSALSFSPIPSDIEFADVDTQITSYTLVEGSVSVNCAGCGATYAVHDVCAGESTGSIDITLIGNCDEPISYMWSNSATTEDLNGVPPGQYIVTITTGSHFIIDTIEITVLDPIQVSANISDASMNDGAIDIMVSGGKPPYNFLWNTNSADQNLSNLSPGQYTVTITDANGCTFVAGPYTVNDANSIAADVTNVACFGESTGSVNVTGVNCVQGPFTYQWSGSSVTGPLLENLPAGTYSVTVTGSGGSTCSASFDVLQAPSAITVAIDTMNETSAGNDGEIHLMVSGGQPPYTYQWNDTLPALPDQTGLTVGEYDVTITDQFGCAVVETILLSGRAIYAEIVGSSYNGYGVSCTGECDGEILALVGNAAGAITYHWSNNSTGQLISNICPGSYSVTVTDQLGNTATTSYIVTAPPVVLAQIAVTCASEPGVPNGSAIAQISGGVPPYTYLWSDNSTSSSVQNVAAGPYILTVTDGNGCILEKHFDICIEGIECYQAITVITPNGDGKNDWFTINCVYDTPNVLSIYNRYGGLEFRMKNYDNSWQGTDQDGNQLSDGGYHWILQVNLPNGDQKVYSGTVSVLRSLD